MKRFTRKQRYEIYRKAKQGLLNKRSPYRTYGLCLIFEDLTNIYWRESKYYFPEWAAFYNESTDNCYGYKLSQWLALPKTDRIKQRIKALNICLRATR